MIMKTLVAAAVLMLGAAGAARAQEVLPNPSESSRNVAMAFSSWPEEGQSFLLSPVYDFSPSANFLTAAHAGPSGPTKDASPSPSPSPAPDPRFVFGGRDDFRWQLGLGADWIRFRSTIFNASAVGIKTSVTYFTNEWFGVEGNVSAAFAPTIYQNEHVKVLVYGAGPKIAWRERRWEPWAHAIFGGGHEQPKVASHSKNTFAAELGGGADYRVNPRLSARLEANWVHTNYFAKSQNNFELMGGVVFHF